MPSQRCAPGMSRLERLPDELKLKIGCFLMALPVPKTTCTGAPYPPGHLSEPVDINNINNLDDAFTKFSRWQRHMDEIDIDTYCIVWAGKEIYNDSVLALACTSSRLCNIFLVEHSKKYGLQNTLYRSIELGDINLVQCAVEYGADINKKGTRVSWRATPLQLAVRTEQLPIILYLLRRGVDKADELLMEALHYIKDPTQSSMAWTSLVLSRPLPSNHCRCSLLRALTDATLGSSQACLPRETHEALAPTGRHLWFILRTYMMGEWGCDCSEVGDDDCPMRLISLLQQCGAKWMPCGPFEDMTQGEGPVFDFRDEDWEDDWGRMYNVRYTRARGLADLQRFSQPLPQSSLPLDLNDPIFIKPSVAGATHPKLLANKAYRRDHCIPFLVAMLEHGVAAEQGDLSHAMDLAIMPDTRKLSIAIVGALLQGGTDPNEPGAMRTAMRLACMSATRDAGLAFATLLLEHGADPGVCELRDEIHCAAEKWWVQSAWQSSGVFRRILGLLVEGGLDKNVAREILAVLGLDHDALAEEAGASVEV